MNIVSINATHTGSTGTIMRQVARCARGRGHAVTTFSTESFSFSRKTLCASEREVLPEIEGHCYYGSRLARAIHVFGGVLTGGNGCFSILSTARLLREIDRLRPDLIHLHNLHDFCINLPMLFRYLKKKKCKVVWTFHDCWPLTGHCSHFDMIGCDKWKTQCYDCPQYRTHPTSYVDNSKRMFDKKRKWFTGVEDMTIVAPSRWMASSIEQSFMKDYSVEVIYNGIDLSIFKPTQNDFRKQYHCENRFILLGVAAYWDDRKGLDVFIELARRLDPNQFQIVIVGTDDEVDKQLPDYVISIHHTENPTELAKIYTAADVFVNPTREEVLGLVNLEALACGTPVITFDTGGSPECIDESCGIVVPKNDVFEMEKAIYECAQAHSLTKEACIKRVKLFEKHDRFMEYVKLYEANPCIFDHSSSLQC